METASYFQSAVIFFTPATICLAVNLGLDANFRGSPSPVTRTLTCVPPTSITRAFITPFLSFYSPSGEYLFPLVWALFFRARIAVALFSSSTRDAAVKCSLSERRQLFQKQPLTSVSSSSSGLLNPCLAKGCGVTGVWQVTEADIGRRATLLLGSKRRALAEFEECTFTNNAHEVLSSGANRSELDPCR
jgi:hypothetical protein